MQIAHAARARGRSSTDNRSKSRHLHALAVVPGETDGAFASPPLWGLWTLFCTFWRLLAPVGSSATGAARMIHNRQAANIQRQTQNACQCRHLRGSCNHTAAHTPPVSHCAERLFRFHKRPSSPSARLAPARRRTCTCKPHAKPAPAKRLSRPSRSFRPRAPWRARAGTAPG